MDAWWSDQTAGLVGGIAGSVVGILGGTLGTLAGICAPKGKCKSLVYALTGLIITSGVITLVVGIVAVVLRQPFFVWYPLILVGCVTTFVVGGITPVIALRYRQAEMRRLEAEEFRRSA